VNEYKNVLFFCASLANSVSDLKPSSWIASSWIASSWIASSWIAYS
jgi:hypothetical protein